ncbi:hypothetical protein ABZ622_04005 [Streptomyces sp. NPDC007164]|uniref:hypothetical protein n=1 Tax=Streptomyces sp. NPDC007164 TaxID=3156918 RepID=UPI0033CE7C9D
MLSFGDGWLDVDAYARSFEEEGSMYEYFLQAGICRVASAAWKRGQHRTAETYLVQFGSTAFQGAKDYAEAQHGYLVAGDTLTLVVQPRKGKEGTRSVPFHQTVILQNQLLG